MWTTIKSYYLFIIESRVDVEKSAYGRWKKSSAREDKLHEDCRLWNRNFSHKLSATRDGCSMTLSVHRLTEIDDARSGDRSESRLIPDDSDSFVTASLALQVAPLSVVHRPWNWEIYWSEMLKLVVSYLGWITSSALSWKSDFVQLSGRRSNF